MDVKGREGTGDSILGLNVGVGDGASNIISSSDFCVLGLIDGLVDGFRKEFVLSKFALFARITYL